MKKKIIALLMGAVLCLGMSVTAFAAESPTIPNEGNALINGENVPVTIKQSTENFTEETKAAWAPIGEKFEKVDSAEKATAEFAPLISEKAGVTVSQVLSYGWTDISLPGYDLNNGGKGTLITFPAPGFSEGDRVVVLHVKSNGEWESLNAIAGNGKITAAFTSLSPIAFFKVTLPEDTAQNQTYGPNNWDKATWDQYWSSAKNAEAQTNAASVSPKTGEADMSFAVVLFGVAAVLAAAYGKRRL